MLMIMARKGAQPLKTSRAIATKLDANSQVARVKAIAHTRTQHSSENVAESHTPNRKITLFIHYAEAAIAVRAAWCI